VGAASNCPGSSAPWLAHKGQAIGLIFLQACQFGKHAVDQRHSGRRALLHRKVVGNALPFSAAMDPHTPQQKGGGRGRDGKSCRSWCGCWPAVYRSSAKTFAHPRHRENGTDSGSGKRSVELSLMNVISLRIMPGTAHNAEL
jgi:hypothetical protein